MYSTWSNYVMATETMTSSTSEQTQQLDETHTFGTDIQNLMNIIVHSFYSNKDIFLRELVSNSSDALDKVRYRALSDPTLMEMESKFEIKIEVDKDNNVLKITDTGIGMDKEDILKNIGTIASSGTKRFMETLKKEQDNTLIGKFGVGFYSAFLVADSVSVHSKKGDKQYVWTSDGTSTFTVKEEVVTLTRGTQIELVLNEDASKEYLNVQKLKEIIKTHSQFISFPIYVLTEKTRTVEVEEEEENVTEPEKENANDDEDDDKPKIEEVTEDEPEKKKEKKTREESYEEWDLVNDQKPIWTRKEKTITNDEYKEFFKTISGGSSQYAKHVHFDLEGQLNVKGILYMLKTAPFDMFQKNQIKNSLKLYVKRVFITDKFDDMLPEYMNFVKGVVDSDDLPLTVSREVLQNNGTIKQIKKQLTKQVLKALNEYMDEDREAYNEFFSQFSKSIKLGVNEDEKNRDKIKDLLLYHTCDSETKYKSLKEYVSDMKEGQPGIYYITGESIEKVKTSPFMQKLKEKNYDVLYMVEPIDEYISQYFDKYEDKKFICITKGDIDLGENDDEKKAREERNKSFETLCKKMKDVLKGKIENVKVSDRIVDSPCCLVSSGYGWTANMERIMKAQALGNNDLMKIMAPKKVLEINVEHPIFKELQEKVDGEEDITNEVELLYYSSHLDSGFSVDNPTELTSRIYAMMTSKSSEKIMSSEKSVETEFPEVVKAEKVEHVDDGDGIKQEVTEINV